MDQDNTDQTIKPNVIEKIKDKQLKPKHAGWRPHKFTCPLALAKRIDEYRDYCKEGKKHVSIYQGEPHTYTKPIPPTVSGLASFLWTNRETLVQYQEKDLFSDAIKEAKQKIQASYEENLLDWTHNPAGAIFVLKNNYWRKDKTEVQQINANIDLNAKDLDEKTPEELEEIRRSLLE